jgi:hypothetical protein
MAIFHVEVHSRDRQIEHYVVPNCSTQDECIERIKQFYVDKGQRVGLWERETDRGDLIRFPYLIFRIDELPGDPVIYISGEYRSQFPI